MQGVEGVSTRISHNERITSERSRKAEFIIGVKNKKFQTNASRICALYLFYHAIIANFKDFLQNYFFSKDKLHPTQFVFQPINELIKW